MSINAFIKHEIENTHLQLFLQLIDGAYGQQQRPREERADVEHCTGGAADDASVFFFVGL